MGKLIFWVVIIFAILFALRMWNARKARARGAAPKHDSSARETMVRCVSCGVFLPKPDAQVTSDGYHCTDPTCVHRTPS